jgi:hypothetical protein
MTRIRVCPSCLGEGERRDPPYGSLRNGAWVPPVATPVAYRVISTCKPCKGSGYLKPLPS